MDVHLSNLFRIALKPVFEDHDPSPKCERSQKHDKVNYEHKRGKAQMVEGLPLV